MRTFQVRIRSAGELPFWYTTTAKHVIDVLKEAVDTHGFGKRISVVAV